MDKHLQLVDQVLARVSLWSPSAGSGPRFYCILVSPFTAAPDPIEDTFKSADWGDGSWWACWSDMLCLGRWSPSLQPPPLQLSPSRPNRTYVPVGPTATGSGLQALQWLATCRRFQVTSKWKERRYVSPPAMGLVVPPLPARAGAGLCCLPQQAGPSSGPSIQRGGRGASGEEGKG